MILKHKIFCLLWAFVCLLGACSDDDNGTPPPDPDEMPIVNLSMPSATAIYKPGQTISIGGYGFTESSVIAFRSAADTGAYIPATNFKFTDYNISFTTPSVYDL